MVTEHFGDLALPVVVTKSVRFQQGLSECHDYRTIELLYAKVIG